MLGDAPSADPGKRVEPACSTASCVFSAVIFADPLYSHAHALLYRLAVVHVFFFLKLLDHHCHRMDDMQLESEASRWKPFSHNTIQPR